jgi:hypothetical protein
MMTSPTFRHASRPHMLHFSPPHDDERHGRLPPAGFQTERFSLDM